MSRCHYCRRDTCPREAYDSGALVLDQSAQWAAESDCDCAVPSKGELCEMLDAAEAERDAIAARVKALEGALGEASDRLSADYMTREEHRLADDLRAVLEGKTP